jgi:hypothetical protein
MFWLFLGLHTISARIFTLEKHSLKLPGDHSVLAMNGGKPMKKAIIEVKLIKEAAKTSNEKLEREIMEEFLGELPKIPWQDKIEKVTVLDY